jgi:hypothetical protein
LIELLLRIRRQGIHHPHVANCCTVVPALAARPGKVPAGGVLADVQVNQALSGSRDVVFGERVAALGLADVGDGVFPVDFLVHACLPVFVVVGGFPCASSI